MNKIEIKEDIVKILASLMYYGSWKWETSSERVLTMLMQDLGLYPIVSEDKMIELTKINEDLYSRARKEINRSKV